MKQVKWKTHPIPIPNCISCDHFFLGYCSFYKKKPPTEFTRQTNECKRFEEQYAWVEEKKK
jgi:hypothetical protein